MGDPTPVPTRPDGDAVLEPYEHGIWAARFWERFQRLSPQQQAVVTLVADGLVDGWLDAEDVASIDWRDLGAAWEALRDRLGDR